MKQRNISLGTGSHHKGNSLHLSGNYKKKQPQSNISRQEKKVEQNQKWINSVKANSFKVYSTIAGVKHHRDNINREYHMANPHQPSQYGNNNYITLGK